ncbi:class I SAM-dependent RNA methyltransferase [Acidiphilium sp. AL]|uniref:Class I SAM-dependent RNA methyltransferase n=1 Tax=Acidiphilium iwatense TaxID=768198 RepID=A0ABS9DVV5_9PROT|nr:MULTISPECIES: class I SAM-dependent RNA methyltransferase [Acidiphilium]MCF3946861.1 class I SAM-dependent RNA methyltransferase [Acidiphilium iwatense]MCU4161046.1 class I SAM-dependent RNA methyltransferase [Acidiphilium sp. AL]
MSSTGTVPAVCRHFGICGGCTEQDVPEQIYHAAKRERLIEALARAGFADAPVAEMIAIPMGTRRRVDFALLRQGGAVRLGLHAAKSRDVVDIAECPLALPAIAALIAPLRELVAKLSGFRKSGSVLINALDHGLDVSLALDGAASAADRSWLIAFARDHALLRISLGDEPVLVLREPTLDLGGLTVIPPPGGFLQPTVAGEAAIRAAVVAGLPGKLTRKSWIVELYAGVGTLTGALAGHARVHAVEGNKAACAALEAGVRQDGLAGRITVEARDLARRPVTVKELAGAACVVLDPPFDGAGSQIGAILESKVPRAIYVSCNPDVLAREAKLLRQAGYRVVAAAPIDQFPASAHLESVVVFGK